MRQAQNLGSTIQFDLQDDTHQQLKRRYKYWSSKDEQNQLTLDEQSWWMPLSEYLNPLCVLLDKYSCVAANPPYMGQKSMNGELKDYLGKYYPKTKGDLMTVFMEVIPNMTVDHGRFALINLPSWLFLSSFEEIRSHYLHNFLFESLLHMGRGIFGIDFGSVAFAIKKELPQNRTGNYFRLHERNFQHIYYEDIEKLFLYSNNNAQYKYDFSLYRDEDGVREIPNEGTDTGLQLFYPDISQVTFFKIPGSPVAYWVSKNVFKLFDFDLLSTTVNSGGRLKTHDDSKFIRSIWEIDKKHLNETWRIIQNGGSKRKWYGNNQEVVDWSNSAIAYYRDKGGMRNPKFDQKLGVTWSMICSNGFAARVKDKSEEFSSGSPTIFPQEEHSIEFILGFLNTRITSEILSIINPTVNTSVGEVLKLPFIENQISSTSIENLVKLCIDISKKDWNSRELSNQFSSIPILNDCKSLQLAFEKWNSIVSGHFFQLHCMEEALNKIFIESYGLQDELSPELALKDVTILQDELDYDSLEKVSRPYEDQFVPLKKEVVMHQFISYAIGLLMGRYRLDKPGLNIAHPEPTVEELALYKYNAQSFTIDEDAIIPLFGEDSPFADNVVKRFKDVLGAVWGEETQTENINFLNACLAMPVEKFLTEKFWDYHKKVYQKKPIYWLFASPSGSFKVLVYMHRMDKFTVQKIRLNYLHRYTEYLGNEVQQAEANGTATRTIDKLSKALQDCREYDKILKPLADQQITFDLDDGVLVNYTKFKPALAPLK